MFIRRYLVATAPVVLYAYWYALHAFASRQKLVVLSLCVGLFGIALLLNLVGERSRETRPGWHAFSAYTMQALGMHVGVVSLTAMIGAGITDFPVKEPDSPIAYDFLQVILHIVAVVGGVIGAVWTASMQDIEHFVSRGPHGARGYIDRRIWTTVALELSLMSSAVNVLYGAYPLQYSVSPAIVVVFGIGYLALLRPGRYRLPESAQYPKHPAFRRVPTPETDTAQSEAGAEKQSKPIKLLSGHDDLSNPLL